MPILGIIASSFRSAAGPVGAYDALATVTVPSGGVASVTFAGIPSDYKHLQIRSIVRGGSEAAVLASFNGLTGNGHALYGNGSIAGAYQETAGMMVGITPTSGSGSSVFSASVADVLDYSNVNKYKTTRALIGTERDVAGGNSYVFFQSSLWQYTAAVNSITLTINGGSSFAENSQFALYGVK
jgi:hypothetical protein